MANHFTSQITYTLTVPSFINTRVIELCVQHERGSSRYTTETMNKALLYGALFVIVILCVRLSDGKKDKDGQLRSSKGKNTKGKNKKVRLECLLRLIL